MTRMLSFLFILITCYINGQQQDSNQSYDWFQAKYVKFKPGKVKKARALLTNYLYKANEISGRLVIIFLSLILVTGIISLIYTLRMGQSR